MMTVDLSGEWRIHSTEGRFDLRGEVPGSFFHDLERSGHWGDHNVFHRENNRQCVEIANRDFVYARRFEVPPGFFAPHHRLCLEADGLDTIAEIMLNGNTVAHTENMFRRFRFAVNSHLHPGENHLEIHFGNAIAEIARRHARRPLWNPTVTLDGAVHLRKSHCSFGWDWGPQIPDLGIWRPIRLRAYAGARLADFHVVQQHHQGRVVLEVTVGVERWSPEEVSVRFMLTDPEGRVETANIPVGGHGTIPVPEPKLWWANGYGEQPLYTAVCELLRNGQVIDRQEQRLGLRTLRLERKQDLYDESFQFNLNGVAIFARGADYIPEDVYLTRPDRAATARLLHSAVAANFNCLRVWGGGVYPSDDFYDLCDRYGLIVWQDLMFACGVYDVHNPDFYENIKEEVRDNLERIRHHACLGLICGNNEMEWGFVEWPFAKTDEMRAEYLEQYEMLFPQLVAEVCPYLDYWPSSPSSGGGFQDPNADDRGDVHFWQVWHGGQPFTEFRRHYFRFLSEFGFESFPALKTVQTFTTPGDWNIFSPVMEDHQRCEGGNGKILNYISQYFRYPRDFDALLYVSQLSQAEAMRYAVEHLRRHRGRCMGAIYWQLNDNWPVASWSSVDYHGRWKALHYVARRMFDQILISCEEAENTAAIHLSNEHRHAISGVMRWRLLTLAGEELRRGELAVQLPAFTSRQLVELDFTAELQGTRRRERYLSFTFTDDAGGAARSGTAVFAPYKHLSLADPRLHLEVQEEQDTHRIGVTAAALAKFVAIDLRDADLIFPDNFFDLDAGETRQLRVPKSAIDLKTLEDQLLVRSLFDSY